uniref:Phospholipase A2 n=1 Tax=Latimeria chalumnae TaxID=7897 RepID=H3BIC9_LATCH
KLLLFTIITLYTLSTVKPGTSLSRVQRSLFDMAMTLKCYDKSLKIPLFKIYNYGCYCGFGGSGNHTDSVDQCCFIHDCCYRYARVNLRCGSKVKWSRYNYSCRKSQTKCLGKNICSRMACECDRQFAECLTTVTPNQQYYYYNKRLVRTRSPPCS